MHIHARPYLTFHQIKILYITSHHYIALDMHVYIYIYICIYKILYMGLSTNRVPREQIQ